MHVVNLSKIIEVGYPKVIEDAAVKLQKIGYMSVGDFLKELPHHDLVTLTEFSTAISLGSADEDALSSMVMLAEMLAQAEGVPLEAADAPSRAANLMILLALEGLDRKGLANFHREKASLVGDLDPDVVGIIR